MKQSNVTANNTTYTTYAEDQNLTPIQKSVFSLYRTCHEEIGLHISAVIRSMAGRYSDSDIRNTVASLIAEGLIYMTIDSDHARNVSA